MRGREDALFICDGCGDGIPRDGDCLAVRVPAAADRRKTAVLRFCEGCASGSFTLGGALDLIGMRYFAGPAEEAERWETLGR